MQIEEPTSSCKGDSLLRSVTLDPDTVDSKANDLLREFQHDYPTSNLAVLLDHEDSGVVRIGTWIASELGTAAIKHSTKIGALLRHEDRKVRFFALDFVQSSAESIDGSIIAEAGRHICDLDLAVQWKALMFISNADESTLRVCIENLLNTSADQRISDELSFLASPEGVDSDQVSRKLNSPNEVARLVGVAAAARISGSSLHPLRIAAKSSDLTVRKFARDVLERVD